MAEKITTNINISQEEMMLEAARLLEPSTKEPDEMTSSILAKQSGLSMKMALMTLNELEEEGYLKMRKVVVNGHETNAYSPVEEGGWAEIVELLNQRRR